MIQKAKESGVSWYRTAGFVVTTWAGQGWCVITGLVRSGVVRRHGSGRTGVAGFVITAWVGPAWHGVERLGLSSWLGSARQGHGMVQRGLSSRLGMRGSESARAVTAAWIGRGQVRHGVPSWLGEGRVRHSLSSRLGWGWVRLDRHYGLGWRGRTRPGRRHGSVRQGRVRVVIMAWCGKVWRGELGQDMKCHHGSAWRGLGRRARQGSSSWLGPGGAGLGLVCHHGMAWRGRGRLVIMA